MISLLEASAFLLCGGAFMLALLGIFVTIVMPGIDDRTRHFFIPFFSILLLYVILCVADMFTYYDPDLAQAQRIISYFESLLYSLIMPLLTIYLLRNCGEKLRESKLFRFVFVLWIMSFTMLQATLFTNLFYYITDDNKFVRGDLYTLMCAPSVLTIVVTLRGLILRRNKYLKVGSITGVYLMWYSIGRFFIEHLRTDSLMLGGFRVAQIISIILFAVGLTLIIRNKKQTKFENLYNSDKDNKIRF